MVALIGFADHWLLPAGQEARQVFDDAARGAIAEVVGTVDGYGTQLPVSVRPAAERLAADGRKLVPASASHQTQVTVLRDYHEAAQQVVAGCASTTAG